MSRTPIVNPAQRVSPEFQQRINDLIQDKDCTKYQFASSVGISKEVINRACLYGIIPSLQSLIKIADHLDVSLLYLLAKNNENDFIRSAQETTFHERLQQLAREKDQKYSEIAHAMIFPESYFHDWFRTKTLPSLDYLLSIAEYFQVSPDYLLGRTDYRN